MDDKDRTAAALGLRFSWPFALAYLALVEVIWELHEQAHIQVGRLLCGDYGARDFNVWALARGCGAAQPLALLAALAGPLFSFAVSYCGCLLLVRAAAPRLRTWGLALMLAPIPFARFIEAARGQGDEIVVAHRLAGAGAGPLVPRLLAAMVLAALCAPLALAAWRALAGGARWRWILGLSFLPLPVALVFKLGLLNALLRAGWLDTPRALGTPVLVWIYFVLMGALLAWRAASIGALRPAGT
jgi:hypothetical protein